jgi:hypothetical protein
MGVGKCNDINQTVIIKPSDFSPVVSACTALYVTNVYPCTTGTPVTINGHLLVNDNLSANTVSSVGNIFSGGTNLLNIFAPYGSNTNDFTTGTTLIGETVYFNRNDVMSAYTLDLSGLTTVLEDGNGTTASGSSIDLGGTLSQSTIIIGGNQNLELGTSSSNLSNFKIKSTQADELYSAPNLALQILKNPGGFNVNFSDVNNNYLTTLDLNSGVFNLKALNNTTGGYAEQYANIGVAVQSANDGGGNKSEVVTTPTQAQVAQTVTGTSLTSGLKLDINTGYKFEDVRTSGSGLEYGADYSANYTNRSLVDKAFVLANDTDTFVTGATFSNNQLNITLNNGTSVETTIDNLSGLTVDGDVLINGDVNIIGSATTINSEQVLIKDNIITLNSNVTGSTTPVLNSGFEVLRGSGDTKSILWLENTDLWSVDDDLSVNGYVSGTTYYGDGSNLTGIDDTFVTGGTYSGSTIILNRNDGNTVNVTGITSDSIYTANGTLTGDRIVNLDSKSLTITGGTTNNATPLNFEFGGYWQGYTRWADSGAVAINVNNNDDALTIFNKVNSTNFKSRAGGGGYLGLEGSGTNVWRFNDGDTANSGVEIGRNAQKFYFGGGLMHNIQQGGAGGGVHFYQSGISGSLGYFIVGGNTRIGAEKISLQEDTLVSKKLELSTTTDGFLMPRLTTAQMNAISSPDTYLKILNIDDNREYRYNGSAWVSNEYVEYDFALRSSGVTTYYADFYTCYNASVAGDVIDVQTDQTVDCGNITSWTWTNDITINLNGHHVNCTNLQRLYIETSVNVKMTNGTFSVESTSINTAAIMFKGGNTFVGDGAVTVYQSIGGSTRGSFTGAGARSKVSGVIMKGSHTYCAAGYITLDNCILYKPTGGPETIYGDNVRVNNSTIYGPVFGASGNYSIPSRETVRTFNNCVIITDGESAIGARSAIFNNCSIKTNDDEVRNGIGGEQEYNNCKIERTGTSGTAFSITNASNVRMYNTQIISTGNGVSTNLPMEFYNCYIKANGGAGIINTTGAGMIIRGGTIDSTGGSALLFSIANVSGIAEVSNVTLMCNTTGKYCLEVNTNTTLTFSNLSMKNTSTSTDVLNRVSILSDNLQINTLDNLGNIVLA